MEIDNQLLMDYAPIGETEEVEGYENEEGAEPLAEIDEDEEDLDERPEGYSSEGSDIGDIDDDDLYNTHTSTKKKRFEVKKDDPLTLPFSDREKFNLVVAKPNSALAHQVEAIRVGKDKLLTIGCFLLADDPGLGKTRSTLELLSEMLAKGDKVILIVPRSLDSTWINQIKLHFKAPWPNMVMLDSKITSHQVEQGQIFIATTQMLMNCTDYVPDPSPADVEEWFTYRTSKAKTATAKAEIRKGIEDSKTSKEIKEQTRKWKVLQKRAYLAENPGLKKFNEVQWTAFVVDEGHKLRNKDSGSNKVMRTIAQKSKYRITLTGTVFNNASEELYAYLLIMQPKGNHTLSDEYLNKVRKTQGQKFALEGLWMSPEKLNVLNERELEKPEDQRMVYAPIEVDFEATPVPKSENTMFRKLYRQKVKQGFDSFALYSNSRTTCCVVRKNPNYVVNEDEEPTEGQGNEFVFQGLVGSTKGKTYNSFVKFCQELTGQDTLTAADCYNNIYLTPTMKIWAFYYAQAQKDQLAGLSATDQERREKKIEQIRKKIRAGALALPVEYILNILGIRRKKEDLDGTDFTLAKKKIVDVNVKMSMKQYKFYKAVAKIESANKNPYNLTTRLMQCSTHPLITLYSAQNKKGEMKLNIKYNPKKNHALARDKELAQALMYPEDELTPKIAAVTEVLKMIKSKDPLAKSILITHSKRLVNLVLLPYLQEQFGTKAVAEFNGDLSKTQKEAQMTRFKTDPNCTIMLLIGSLAVGLDIPEASNVLQVEHHWNPANEQQGHDRAHRIGQKKDVTIYRFISTWPDNVPEVTDYEPDHRPITMDEKVIKRLSTKREALGQYDAEKYMNILKTKKTTIKEITEEYTKQVKIPADQQESELLALPQEEEYELQEDDSDESDREQPARKKLKL